MASPNFPGQALSPHFENTSKCALSVQHPIGVGLCCAHFGGTATDSRVKKICLLPLAFLPRDTVASVASGSQTRSLVADEFGPALSRTRATVTVLLCEGFSVTASIPAKRHPHNPKELPIPESPFQVWLRPLGDKFRLRVEAQTSARWLIGHLESLPGSARCESLNFSPNGYTFNVPLTSDITRSRLLKVLCELTEVEVMSQPA